MTVRTGTVPQWSEYDPSPHFTTGPAKATDGARNAAINKYRIIIAPK
jgi:hypothetical protein